MESIECGIIGRTRDNPGPRCYEAILPLRCLLLKQHRPEEWQYFASFESHINQLKSVPGDWAQTQANVVEQIRSGWSLADLFPPEEVEMVEGILYINTLEMPAEGSSVNHRHRLKLEIILLNMFVLFQDSSLPSGRAFYPLTSFASHDCVNNTFRTRGSREEEMGEESSLSPARAGNYQLPGFQTGDVVETRAKVDIKGIMPV